jgi:hypothetical protein
MTAPSILSDERTVAVENASYRWAYLVLSFGLLASVAWRGFVRHETAWDLLALVVVGGVVATAYQGTRRVLSRRWALAAVAAAVVAVVAAALLAAGAGR